LAITTITRCPKKSKVARFVTDESVFETSGHDASYRTFPDYTVVDQPVPAALADHIALKPPEIRRNLLTQALADAATTDFARLARSHQFPFLADLFDALNQTEFDPNSRGANLSPAAMARHLATESLFLAQEQGDAVRRRRVRNALLLGDSRRAIDVLMAAPPANPAFALDLVKAALVSGPPLGAPMLVSAAALVAAGNVEDAVDLLMVTKEMKEAVKVLLRDGQLHAAFQIIRASAAEDCEAEVEAAVAANGNGKLVGALLAFGQFRAAEQALRAGGREFEASVIGGLKFSEQM
jgi:hypothetical protein